MASVAYAVKLPDEEQGTLPPSRNSEVTLEGSEHSSRDNKKIAPAPPSVPIEAEKTEKDSFLVQFDGDADPAKPMNWSRGYRWWLTFLACMFAVVPSFASSMPSGNLPDMIQTFGFSIEVGTLTVSLYLCGYCLGPILWAPLSENYGRKIIFIISFTGFVAWNVGCALSQNTASIMIFRFLAGTFGVAPVTNSGAIMGDIWEPKTRLTAVALFTVAPVSGPSLAPMVAGFISVTNTDWRWGFWAVTIWAGVTLATIVFLLPETFAPQILVNKAKKLRKETGDERYKAPLEMLEIAPAQRAADILVKPWKIFFKEPMLIAIHTFMAFQYGTLYLLFEAFPIVFGEIHGFNAGEVGLALIDLLVGGVLSVAVVVFYANPRYLKKVAAAAPNPVPPEATLELACAASIAFAVSFFWFGWTSYENVSYWSPIAACVLMSMGCTISFFSLQTFIINVYLSVAASALATNVILRSAVGAAFPLFARQMFNALNPRWACTLLGCIALLLAPIPFLFVRYGPYLRSKSRYTQNKS